LKIIKSDKERKKEKREEEKKNPFFTLQMATIYPQTQKVAVKNLLELVQHCSLSNKAHDFYHFIKNSRVTTFKTISSSIKR
jgi:hypothetical protein